MLHFLGYIALIVISFWAGALWSVHKLQSNMKRQGLYEDFKSLIKRYHSREARSFVL